MVQLWKRVELPRRRRPPRPIGTRPVSTFVLLALVVVAPAVAAEKPRLGSIHVHAKPGIVVFIDDKPAGISLPGKEGITIPDVSPGVHSLRMTLLGFRSKTLAVTVLAGQTAELEVGDLRVRARIRWRPRGDPVEATVGSPPMVLDDTGTPGDHAFEVNFTFEGDFQTDARVLEAPELDLNYGIGEGIQLKYEVPWGWTRTTVRDENGISSTESSRGVGNSSFGVKYRFYDDDDSGLSLAVYPQVEFRTPGTNTADDGGIASSGTTWVLPALLTKDFERFSITANLGAEKSTAEPHIAGFGGFGAGRRLTDRTALLTEIAARDIGNGGDARIQIDLGVRHKFNESHSVSASVGMDIGVGGDAHRFFTFAYQLLTGKRY
jgi:hypothetical protein